MNSAKQRNNGWNMWEKRYQSGETGWDRGDVSPAVEVWKQQVHPNQRRLLIPGCGYGHEVVYFAQQGYDVTALDIAPSAIRHLKAAIRKKIDVGKRMNVHPLCVDLFDWEPEAPFDAIYEQTCLCAIQPNQRMEYERRLSRWITPGGLLLALFMQTGLEGGPPFHCDLLEMRRLFAGERWQWQEEAPTLVPHRNGRFELAFSLVRKA